MKPTLGARRISAYTILGFAGYAIATLLAIVLARAWALSLVDRLVVLIAPPIAFLVVVSAIRQHLGYERIVFYQTASAAVLSAVLLSAIAGGDATRVLDIATLGVGTFLVLGRIGCYFVACCHGRLARHGVVYGPAHVAAGLWARWAGRTLWPVQLVESALSLALVIGALAVAFDTPGGPALIYITGYGAARFVLELVRGDARPEALGVSEAQWTALATLATCIAWRPNVATLAVASVLLVLSAVLIATRESRALTRPAHVRELAASHADGHRHETSLGVTISCHALPDGRADWILSSTHPHWSTATATTLARTLWKDFELVEGRLPAIVHVIVPGQ